MGYTHYWRTESPLNPGSFERFSRDAEKLVWSHGSMLAGWDGDPKRPPEVSRYSVSLNGRDENAHESFQIAIHNDAFNFCKTARKPYDLIVVALLCLAGYHFGAAITIGSDGIEDDWQAGLILAQSVNARVTLPEGMESD